MLRKPPLDTLKARVLDVLEQERALTFAVLSPDLKVLSASESFRDYLEDSTSEPIGSPVQDLIWELVGNEAGLREVLQGESAMFKLRNINRDLADGARLYFTIKAFPVDVERPGNGLLLLIEDTTLSSKLEQELVQDRNELRLTKRELSLANEELVRLNRLKSLFLSIAAHDLRSPLTAMRGYTDLAIQTVSSEQPQAKDYLSIVVSLTDSLNRLINDFLDLDIIEQGKLNIHPQVCELNRIVQEITDVMRGVAGRKNVRLETRLTEPAPVILVDPERLQQMLFNLISNAIKYTNEGDYVVITTSVNAQQGIFQITDHGPGIPSSEVDKLFDLYHRAEEARQSKIQGLGLGLFIVKSLVNLHGGQISVSSKLGKGTAFTVALPLFQPDSAGGAG